MTSSTHHSFNVHYAAEYGVHEAILIHHFQHWIEFNQRTKKNYREGRTWSYQTFEEISEWFPYLTADQVRDLLHRLCEGKNRKSKRDELEFEPVLIKGNFNKTKYDKTTWYAFINEKMFTKGEIPKNPQGKSPDPENEIPAPIPDTKTDTKKKLASSLDSSESILKEEPPKEKSFFQLTSATMKLNVARMSDLCLPPDECSKLCRHDPEIIEKAMKHLEIQTEVVRKPYTWLQNCIRNEWWNEKAQSNKQLDYYTMFKTSLNDLCKQIKLFTKIVVGEEVIRAYEANGEVREFSRKSFKTESTTLKFLSNFNKLLQNKGFTKKVIIVKIGAEKTTSINIEG